MKDKTGWILALALGLMLTGCAGFSTHQKVAVACESAASALDTLVVAKGAGKISQAQLQDAIAIYKRTTPFCEPVAQDLDAVQKAALDSAVAELAIRAGAAK